MLKLDNILGINVLGASLLYLLNISCGAAAQTKINKRNTSVHVSPKKGNLQ